MLDRFSRSSGAGSDGPISPDKGTNQRSLVFVVNHAAFFASHRLPIALEAQRRGWKVTLISGQAASERMERPALEALAVAEIRHVRTAFRSSGLNPFTELLGFLQLLLAMHRERPDLVHCASPKGVLYGGMAARWLRVCGLVLAISGMGYAFTTGKRTWKRSLASLAYRFMARTAFGHANKMVIVQNDDDSQLLQRQHLATRREIRLIPGSGVDLDKFAVDPASAKGAIVVLPARLLVDKGVVDFVDAVKRIRHLAPGWRFILAGAADYQNPTSVPRDLLDQWIGEGLVEWAGHLDDVSALLKECSIVCLPSYREGFPKALQEGAAAGCAIVTTDATGCRDAVVDGRTGIIVPVGDVDALATALMALISDERLRAAYGSAGRQLAEERFGLDEIVKQNFAVYSDVSKAL